MSKKIVLIDNDVEQTSMYARAFIKEDVDVFVENDPLQATTSVQKISPDLVLLDIVMEKKNGIAVLKEIRENPALKNTPVVMLTNNSNQKEIEELQSMGISGYWEKTKLIPKEVVLKSKALLGL